jgi:membrane protein YqaA with SNARE-associated domain
MRYGFLGIFISSLVGSMIFIPFLTEAALIILSRVGRYPYLLVLIASVGSLMGTWVNYSLGFFGSELVPL